MSSRGRQFLVIVLTSMVATLFSVLTMQGRVSRATSAVALVLCAYGFIGVAGWVLWPLVRLGRRDTLGNQVRELSKSLEEAGEISARLSEQIHTREVELERLRTQSKVAREVLSGLAEEEYDAVVAAIRAQAGREKARDVVLSFFAGVATNVLTFFLLEARW